VAGAGPGAAEPVRQPGVAVREAIMAKGHGRVDYLLYVDKRTAGVIEAKPEGTTLSGVEWQSAMYATGLPETHRKRAITVSSRLPFVFEASGSETPFTNGFDPDPRSRKIFAFPRPETLARLAGDAEKDPGQPPRPRDRSLSGLNPRRGSDADRPCVKLRQLPRRRGEESAGARPRLQIPLAGRIVTVSGPAKRKGVRASARRGGLRAQDLPGLAGGWLGSRPPVKVNRVVSAGAMETDRHRH
jgi:hypothetical protein